MQAHHVRISTFIHGTENEDKVLEALGTFIPEEIPDDDVDFEILETEGYFGNPIKVINLEIKKARHVRAFLRHFKMLLGEENKKYLLEHLDEKIDEEGVFYVRFNKQKAYLGEAHVDEGEDVIQIRIKVKAFPMKKESVVKAVEEWLKE
ncbi:RNA-binding protein [Palaeococcus sp. (in: euryarchaeotes)]|uniref:RNA-binding protein n=1 Tax=Palaeococcus sp. (in: euryarchaeotes) TaxID=2820298 RepID=UPI0025CD720F|nr:RNA-binding protein [Palaeococcus sp. (in: euryarchaeotes)]MCD6559862.1 RNA-binding protein [Palaeococcus sp. (in: euryarchaeotes)]